MHRYLTAAATAALTVTLLGAAGAAHADSGPAAPRVSDPRTSASDPSGSTARGAASSPAALDLAGRFFASEAAHSAGTAGTSASGGKAPAARPDAVGPAARPAAAGPADRAHVTGPTVEVNTLNPAFVSGDPAAPVALPDFWATEAVAADGRTASVWTVRSGGSWKVVNIASGADESGYAARAAADGGGSVFREPQINAWYALRAGRVLPLNDEARQAVGAHGATVAAYQRQVHGRYADKLPGSVYDRDGSGGGFRPRAARDGGTDPAAVAAGAGAAALGLAAAGAWTARRRRTARVPAAR
ncbi:hypothetical protein SAMN05216251_109141 [Actinacidiphila alni]|uniref:Uncharacterized protein n=1 Tax=Actinacidiphila alni TaxID=380248 RepID=A0A1I2GLH1_9ACTN|nr:hypothetical protein [Actinacidiphila alni]SFF18063.1 hypothetical protein SAMN05216251_109141 [Actinacidiphila alni]